jgi:Fe-S-cluster containining protein
MKDARAQRAARLETRAVYRQADALYASFSCPASSECCQLARTGRQPWLWPSEWWVLEERLRADGREIHSRADGACPLLTESGRCSVYADRPFGCRTFFCERARGDRREPLAAVNALQARLERTSRNADPDAEPRPLLAWLSPLPQAGEGQGEGDSPQ